MARAPPRHPEYFHKWHKNLCECSTCSERKVVKCPFGSAATLGLLCALNHWLRVRDLNVVGLQPKSKFEQSMILKWWPTTAFFLPPWKPDRDLHSKSSVSLSPKNPPDQTIESSSSLPWVLMLIHWRHSSLEGEQFTLDLNVCASPFSWKVH